jgi:hypothetical protein
VLDQGRRHSALRPRSGVTSFRRLARTPVDRLARLRYAHKLVLSILIGLGIVGIVLTL